MTIMEWTDMSVTERAAEAWAAKADLDSKSALTSLRAQALKKLKLRSEDLEISADHFDDEVAPGLRLAAFVDGVTLCLTREKELAAMVWECAEGGCTERHRLPISDYISLGRAIALGDKEEAERPHCRAHKKKGERW